MLFDGKIPVYHLYYGNGAGDLSTLLTSFPYRQAGLMGTRGTNQAKRLNLSVPVGALDYWSERLAAEGVEVERLELFGTDRLRFWHAYDGARRVSVGPNHVTRAARAVEEATLTSNLDFWATRDRRSLASARRRH